MIVLDCNAAVAIVLETEEGLALQALMLEEEECIAPSLLCSEMANALTSLSRAGSIPKEAAPMLLKAALSLPDRFVDDAELLPEALVEAIRHGHPAYDMFYLVLARRFAATLFTLDRRLQRLCLDNGVECVLADTGC